MRFAGLLLAAGGLPLTAVASNGAPGAVGAGSILQLLFGLVLVIGAIFATAFLFRRFSRLPSGVAGSLKVLAGLSVGTRERVVLVQVGDKQLLLGVAPGRVQTLHVLEQPIPVAPATGVAASEGFAERLAQLMKGKGA
jgi:flagellar protein FliO/FliZ